MNHKKIINNFVSDGKYILFHCHHLSTLYQYVLFRLTRYRSNMVVLLVNNDLFCQSQFAENLENRKVFHRILAIKEPKNFEEKQREQFVVDYYDDYFAQNGLCFDDMLEIYTACDLNNLFPIYCTLNNRAISYIEMYEGQFRDEDRYRFCTTVFGYPLWMEELYRKYCTLSGDGGRYTNKRYLWYDSIREYPEKDVNMDFLKGFYSLPADAKSLIVDCMALPPKVDFRGMNLLLLNSPRWTKTITDLEIPYHYLPYLLISDYYFETDNLFIKNHPHAGTDQYFVNDISQRTNTIPTTVPIEFYGLVDGFCVKRLVSIASTGNLKISRFVSEEIQLSKEYLLEYQYIHKVYLTLFLAHRYGETFSCEAVGISNDFLAKLNLCAFPSNHDKIRKSDPCVQGYRIYQFIGNKDKNIKECVSFSMFNKNCVTVFLDTETLLNRLPEIQKSGFNDQLISIAIEKTAIYDHILSDTQKEFLLLFCTDKEYIRKIKATAACEYVLHYTGLQIRAEVLDKADNDVFSILSDENA